jgi:4-amino-4-deoxy-L-arabinose transferase-like glycosyltransferase
LIWAPAAGFALRVASIFALHTYRFRVTDDHFAFGYETGRIARSIALGQGFSNPFHGITGPTAWEAPLYPYLLAGVFKLTGVYSSLSAILILILNSLFSALTAIPVYLLAKRIFGTRVAAASAWAWALFPYPIYWAVRWVWETSLTTFLLACAIWLTVEIANSRNGKIALWIVLGTVWGTIALANPSCLILLPFLAGWLLWRLSRKHLQWLRGSISCALVFLLLVIPWEMRNYAMFGIFMPIRSNAGAELRLGNGPEATGIWMEWLHPTQNPRQLEDYRSMGEIQYVRSRGREVLSYVRQHPASAVIVCLKKAWYYWAGAVSPKKDFWLQSAKNLLFLLSSVLAWAGLVLAMRRRKPDIHAFFLILAIGPVPFYLAFPHARYRHPIEPIMMILAVYVLMRDREKS